jgi:hypothetical protein
VPIDFLPFGGYEVKQHALSSILGFEIRADLEIIADDKTAII